jgi:hypothetical protein
MNAAVLQQHDLEHSPFYIFGTHAAAEDAVRKLGNAGFDMKKLSLVGKGYHTEEHPVGFYTTGDRIKTWGGIGAFWGGIWGLLFAPAIIFFPGLGLLAMAGPIAIALVGAVEGAVVVGGLSAFTAALSRIGIHKDNAIKYETALKSDKYLLIVHGSAEDTSKVRSLLAGSKEFETA